MNKELRLRAYRDAKRRILKVLPGAKVKANERAGFYVADVEGRNVIAQKYPALAYAKDVMSAWINLDIVGHWNKTEKRNDRKFRNDKQTVAVQGDWHHSSNRIDDYINHIPNWRTSDGQPEY
tara:strand:- start:377 stop:742 length:366 start_codon:yes stop_codon:yes gene_type:complete